MIDLKKTGKAEILPVFLLADGEMKSGFPFLPQGHAGK